MYLLRKNIIIKRPNDKLNFKKLKPFTIIQKILKNNYKLLLPKTIQIHPIFYISLLESIPKSAEVQKRRIEVALYQIYKIKAIFNEQRQRRTKSYLVKWKGYNFNENI